ncbi:MAG: helix-turn-helix domain-containing protein [Bacteroidales bacterium]
MGSNMMKEEKRAQGSKLSAIDNVISENSETSFRFYKMKKDCIKRFEAISTHIVCFVLTGEMIVINDLNKQISVNTGKMFYMLKYSHFDSIAKDNVHFLVFSFERLINPVDKLFFQSLNLLDRGYEYEMAPLEIKKPLHSFIRFMLETLNEEIWDHYYFRIKHKEFFILLRSFYGSAEVQSLFYPLITQNIDFKSLIMDTYQKDSDLNALIKASCLSRSIFMKVFKKEFGITAYQWIMKQRCKRIIYYASLPGATIKDVMYKVDFDSPSHFNRFCRKHFNCTPKELLRKCQSNN